MSQRWCHEHPRGRSLPWEKEEGGGLRGGPCNMNRSLPDVEVREEGRAYRRNTVYKTQSSLGGGEGGAKKTSRELQP